MTKFYFYDRVVYRLAPMRMFECKDWMPVRPSPPLDLRFATTMGLAKVWQNA